VGRVQSESFRKLALAVALAAPLALPFYLLVVLRAPVAAYVIAIFYSQTVSLAVLNARKLSRV